MSIVAGFFLPHNANLVPEISHDEDIFFNTKKALNVMAQKIAEIKPDTIVIISPHGEAYSDFFQLGEGLVTFGNFQDQGAPQLNFRCLYDSFTRKVLDDLASAIDFPAGSENSDMRDLDHGVMVPLYFINPYFSEYELLRVGISGLPLIKHYELGKLIHDAFEKTGKKAVIIASGDLSHAKNGSPSDQQLAFDEAMVQIMRNGNFGDLFNFPREELRVVRQCGARPLAILAGALDGHKIESAIYSYENQEGIGAAVVYFDIKEKDSSRCFGDLYLEKERLNASEASKEEDDYVQLARKVIKDHVTKAGKTKLNRTKGKGIPNVKGGLFVEVEEFGERKAIAGEITQTRRNLTTELVTMARVCAMDNFEHPPIKKEDLPYITIKVMVVKNLKKCSLKDIDPQKHGIYITKMRKSGSVFPEEGNMKTPKEMLDTAKLYAGISPSDNSFEMYSFEIETH